MGSVYKYLSGCRELNSGLTRPMGKYYRYTTPRFDYFCFPVALMHLVQAKTRSPESKRVHWRLGYFLFLTVGLYFPRSFTRF